MAISSPTRQPVRFGTYELDVAAAELRHRGINVKLQEQPLRVLQALLERPGEIVSREELRQRVWASDTFVDFEAGLNAAVRKLRHALRDDADNPRFVETLPKRGYRFIAPIIEPREVSAPEAAPQPRRSSKKMVITLAVTLVASVISAGFVVTRRMLKQVPSAETRRSVAVVGFKQLNPHPDSAWLATALAETLSAELAAGGQLRTVPTENVSRMRTDLLLPDSDSYSKDSLTRIGKILGADDVICGAYLKLGEDAHAQMRVDLRLQDARTGETVATISETGSEADLLVLVFTAGAQLRQRLGVEALTPAQSITVRASMPLQPEALHLYAEGIDYLRHFDSRQGRDRLLQTVAAEPQFALAHAALADAWANLGYDQRAIDEAKKALDFSTKLSREDQLLLEAKYLAAKRQWSEAVETYKTLWKFFPDNLEYGLALAHWQTRASQYQDSLVTIGSLRKLSRIDPRIDLEEANSHFSLSHFQEAASAASIAVAKGKGSGARLVVASALLVEGNSLEWMGNNDGAEAAYREAERIYEEGGNHLGAAWAFGDLALVAQRRGDLEGARNDLESVLALDRETGAIEEEAKTLLDIGDALEDQGDLESAIRRTEQAMTLFREVDDKGGVAISLSNTGILLNQQGHLMAAKNKIEQARELYGERGKNWGWANATRHEAEVLVELGDLAAAKRLFEQARAVDERIQDKYGLGEALAGIGGVLENEGNLKGARQSYEQALALHRGLGNTMEANEVLVSIGEVSIEEGRTSEVEAPLRKAIEEFQREKNTPDEALAYTVLAESLLSNRRITSAQQVAAKAAPLVAKSENRSLHFRFALTQAKLRAASGKPHETAAVRRTLEQTEAEAAHDLYVRWQLEARLELATMDTEWGDMAAGQAHLADLARDARRKGYSLIAQRSSSRITAGSSQPTRQR